MWRSQASDWEPIEMPRAFFFSSIVIAFSSVALHFANRSFKYEDYKGFFSWIGIALGLGIAFCLLQFSGWRFLSQSGVRFQNIGGSFIYILTGLHFFHLILGLGGLAWLGVDGYKNKRYVDGYIGSLNPAKRSLLKMVTIFWHFLALLWYSLFLVLFLGLKN